MQSQLIWPQPAPAATGGPNALDAVNGRIPTQAAGKRRPCSAAPDATPWHDFGEAADSLVLLYGTDTGERKVNLSLDAVVDLEPWDGPERALSLSAAKHMWQC